MSVEEHNGLGNSEIGYSAPGTSIEKEVRKCNCVIFFVNIFVWLYIIASKLDYLSYFNFGKGYTNLLIQLTLPA